MVLVSKDYDIHGLCYVFYLKVFDLQGGYYKWAARGFLGIVRMQLVQVKPNVLSKVDEDQLRAQLYCLITYSK